MTYLFCINVIHLHFISLLSELNAASECGFDSDLQIDIASSLLDKLYLIHVHHVWYRHALYKASALHVLL